MSLASKNAEGISRRVFLNRGTLVFIGVTTGALTWQGCGDSSEAIVKNVASFGWEISNLSGNGANAYFKVMRKMVLDSVDVDLAFMITAAPVAPGFAEVLCQAAVSRSGPPAFTSSRGPDYLPVTSSPDFGNVTIDNPNGLQIVNNTSLAADVFHSVILKAWVPADGTSSSTSRHTTSTPLLTLNAGDYLVFHMDHAGVPLDCEMQVVLNYE